MSIFSNLLGGTKYENKPLTAREACEIAVGAAADHLKGSDVQQPCFIYSCPMDSNIEISHNGRSRAWHIDFAADGQIVLVRLQKGRIKITRRPWDQTGNKPVEYVAAIYGRDVLHVADPPPALPGDYLDSCHLIEAVSARMDEEISADHVQQFGYGPLAILYPGAFLRYAIGSSEQRLLHQAPPGQACAVIMWTPENLEVAESYAVFIHMTTGAIVQVERFRFPSGLFNYGISADW